MSKSTSKKRRRVFTAGRPEDDRFVPMRELTDEQRALIPWDLLPMLAAFARAGVRDHGRGVVVYWTDTQKTAYFPQKLFAAAAADGILPADQVEELKADVAAQGAAFVLVIIEQRSWSVPFERATPILATSAVAA